MKEIVVWFIVILLSPFILMLYFLEWAAGITLEVLDAK